MEPVRDSTSAYDRYLAAMDASMRQKVALTAAHLLAVGTVADMGMGSGTGSHALAALYASLEVWGVDVDAEMVARARDRHRLPNLGFKVGDIATPTFEPNSLDAILDSSVLHHVTTFGGYDRTAARRALEVQVEALAPEGILVVRDFLDPGPGQVWLDLPADDGAGDTPLDCSTADLFERFATEFRALRPPGQRGFAYRRLEGPDLPEDWRRYELAHTPAVEFILRKDYRADWDSEVLEEYCFATQPELEEWFGSFGLRILASTPLRNPWITERRFRGRLVLRDTTGRRLDFPATNVVVVGQKVRPGKGVRFRASPAAPTDYLTLTHWRRTTDDRLFDLARRPNLTLDVIPFFVSEGQLFVLARRSYPRPIATMAAAPSVDGSHASPWLSEPIVVVRADEPVGETVTRALLAYPTIGEDGIRSMKEATTYYPSPGGLQEEVRAVHVEIAPAQVDTPLATPNGFTSAGTLRAMEACQLLRAAQVGALPDARLEHNVYDLLLDRGLSVGPWIGDVPELPEGSSRERHSLGRLLDGPRRRVFRRAAMGTGFLGMETATFQELDTAGNVVGERVLSWVAPRALTPNTITVALLGRVQGEVLLGIDDDDLPAAQSFTGNSNLLVAPAWRLPRDVSGVEASRAWITARIIDDYGLCVRGIWELGGRYHPSAGVTPEVVWPLAFAVDPLTRGKRALSWVPLLDLVRERDRLHDGHLRTVGLRAAHALGLLAG
jgi:SAM-dependent methyltransferase